MVSNQELMPAKRRIEMKYVPCKRHKNDYDLIQHFDSRRKPEVGDKAVWRRLIGEC